MAEGADDGVVGECVWHNVRLSRLSQQPHRCVGVAKLVAGSDGGVVRHLEPRCAMGREYTNNGSKMKKQS